MKLVEATRHTASARSVRGVSLIELMVALAIGSLLVLGLVEVFSASRTAYQLSEGLSRVQENSRFAMDYIQRDFRMGGHMGCVNDQARFLPENAVGTRSALASSFLTQPQQLAEDYTGGGSVPGELRFDLPVEGYEANGTGDASTVPWAAPAVNGNAADWTPALPDYLNDPGRLDNRVANSDILVLRQFSPRGAQVTAFTPGDPAAFIQIAPAQLANLQEDQTNPGLFGIGDCMSAGVFRADSVDAAGLITVSTTDGVNKSPMAGYEAYVPGQAFVYVAQTIVYYVGLNGAGVPALYRLRFTMEPGDAAPAVQKEELVEGIESLQLRYGVDSFVGAGTRPSGNMGSSEVAGVATPWRRVGLIQVGMLARSINPAAAAQRDTSVAAELSALGVTFTAPVPGDGRLRIVYENSIAMRNRLFGQ